MAERMGAPVEYLSPKTGATVVLEPDRYVHDPHRGLVLVEPARKAKFKDGRVTLSAADAEILETKPAYTGATEPKIVWRADAGQLPVGIGGERVQVVTGAAHSGMADNPVALPCDGYDQMTTRQIMQAVREGRIRDLVGAINYESIQGQRRSGVLKILGSALGGRKLPDEGVDRDEMATPEPAPHSPGSDLAERLAAAESDEEAAAIIAADLEAGEAIEPSVTTEVPREGVE
jgi:hypothetical protein